MTTVLKFSPKVRKIYPGRRPTIFGEIERSYAEVRKYLRPELKASDVSVVAKIPWKTLVLLQAGLRRALELTESIVREVNAHALVSSFVTNRALFETACVMFYTWKRVETVLACQSRPDLQNFDDDVMQLLIGGRSKEWGGPLHAKNILTIIDHATKTFKRAREHYDGLSEFAHPNYSGMLGMYQRPDNQRARAIFVESWKDNPGRLPMLIARVLESLTIINFVLRNFEGRLPDFIRLSEEEIYRGGTWPKNIPYRWELR